MGSGFSKMKKQARMMQEQYTKVQDELKNKRVTGSSGNGLVTIILDGERNMHEIKIDPQCVDPSDIEGLQDLILAAYENAAGKVEAENPMNDMMPPFGL